MMLYGVKVEPREQALFIVAFVFNAMAEIIRQPLRGIYRSL